MSTLNEGNCRNIILFSVLFMTVPMLTGCASLQNFFWPPYQSPALWADYKKIQTDEAKLFTQLEQTPPACRYSNNAATFTAVEADLTTANTDASAVRNNAHTVAGITDLQKSMTDLQSGVSSSSPCAPSNIIQDEQKTFEDGLNDLITYENSKKPEGG